MGERLQAITKLNGCKAVNLSTHPLLPRERLESRLCKKHLLAVYLCIEQEKRDSLPTTS